MSKAIQVVLGLCLSLEGARAFAYHLDDHARIAAQAFQEFVHCFPGVAGHLNEDALVQADLDEDLNLVVKELMYSHYYNPNKHLAMWRYSSMDRIDNLAPSLQQCRGDLNAWAAGGMADLGHAIHHLQDMTVPAHVVPVSHAAWDGFEVYEDKDDISSEWTCAEIADAGSQDLEQILQQTALDTLASVKQLRIRAKSSSRRRQQREIRGTDFWLESSDGGFGGYGSLGNVFGSTIVNTVHGSMEISESAFREFKTQQMKSAVRATLRAMSWALPQH